MLEIFTLNLFLLASMGICFQRFIFAVKQRVPLMPTGQDFSRTALRIGRMYRVFAYSVLSLSFLTGLVISSYRMIIDL